MLPSRTLRDLLDDGVDVRVDEAVAIVQRLMHDDISASDATGPYGPLALGNVEITSDGHVRAVATAATPSVYEAAALLQDLLSARAVAVPGALRYTLGRALLEVDAPPFDSCQQFGAALDRFERGPRAAVIAALHARATSQPTRRADGPRLTGSHAEYVPTTTPSRPPVGREQPRKNVGPIAGCLLAGVALIIVGGAAPARKTLPSASARATSAPSAVTRDITLPPTSAAIEPPALVRTPVRSAARTTRVAAPGAAATRKRTAPRVARARRAESTDADRGVIARIRFEWDNPFR